MQGLGVQRRRMLKSFVFIVSVENIKMEPYIKDYSGLPPCYDRLDVAPISVHA